MLQAMDVTTVEWLVEIFIAWREAKIIIIPKTWTSQGLQINKSSILLIKGARKNFEYSYARK